MSKRSQQAKDKRKAERDRKKRWGQQQKTLRANQLMRDLTYYEEQGLFASQAKWSETTSQVLWDSQQWRDEPEFRNLAFDPYRTGQAMNLAWQELQFDPEEFEQLSDADKDDRNFELNARAIRVNLSPEFKKDFLQRLERYRLRLRTIRQWEALAQAALVQMVLETSDQAGEAAWPECMLVYQLHYEAVDEYLRLQEAADTALGQAMQTIGHTEDTLDAQLTDEQRTQITTNVEQAARHTPGLLDFLKRAADDMIDEALSAVQDAELQCHLFTKQETDLFFAYFLAALVEGSAGQTSPEDLPPDKRAQVQQLIDEAVADCLDKIDTPQRRAELYATARTVLQDLQKYADLEHTRSRATLLLPLLDDESTALADNEFFIAAISGEFGARWQAEANGIDSHDEASADA
jgi:uncharacterized protein (DUF1697 family)